MAIQQCRDVFVKVRIGGRFYDSNAYECKCDQCASVSVKKGDDAGIAHEKAWKEGFRPRSSGAVHLPMKWECARCIAKRTAA